MRLSKLTVLFAATAAVFATDCATSVRCCETNGKAAGITEVAQVLSLLGIIIPLLTPVWLTCPVLGVGGNCPGGAVCCQNIAGNNAIAIGCISV